MNLQEVMPNCLIEGENLQCDKCLRYFNEIFSLNADTFWLCSNCFGGQNE